MAATLRDLEPFDLQLADQHVRVRVRQSSVARFARIRLGPRHPLEVVVPRGMPRPQIGAFLEERRSWIEEKVTRAAEIAARPPQLGLEKPAVVWIGGREIAVRLEGGRSAAVARLIDGLLVVRGAASESRAVEAVERWYRREGRRALIEATEREAARLKLDPGSVSIRDTRTRWGSCASSKNLSFSWRLIIAPPEVLHYVVIHELCHLREPNHSKSFWRLLEASCPGWQEPARWLRKNGAELHDYRPNLTDLHDEHVAGDLTGSSRS